MTLALIGVSNGAIQFMTYEELKKWRVELRRKRIGGGGNDEISPAELKKLVRSPSPRFVVSITEWRILIGERGNEQSNLEYILMSGSAKLVAISITYPYQVIRSRIQVRSSLKLYPTKLLIEHKNRRLCFVLVSTTSFLTSHLLFLPIFLLIISTSDSKTLHFDTRCNPPYLRPRRIERFLQRDRNERGEDLTWYLCHFRRL